MPDTLGRSIAQLRRHMIVMQQDWGLSMEQIGRCAVRCSGVGGMRLGAQMACMCPHVL